MNTQTLVTNVLLYQENLSSATTGDFVTARKRVKRNAQRVVNANWMRLRSSWKTIRVDLPIVAGVGSLPTNYQRRGQGCGVWSDIGKPPLRWVPLIAFNEMKYRVPNSGPPRVYTDGEADQATGVRSLLFWPTGGATVHLVYERSAPVLVDAQAGVGDVGTDELFLFPEAYHETVIYEGTVYFQMKDKANQQSVTEQRSIYVEGQKLMTENERAGQEAPHNVVPYGTGRR